jgi:hypothetical protein
VALSLTRCRLTETESLTLNPDSRTEDQSREGATGYALTGFVSCDYRQSRVIRNPGFGAEARFLSEIHTNISYTT